MNWISIIDLFLFIIVGAQGHETLWDAMSNSKQPIGKFMNLVKEMNQKSFFTTTSCSTTCYNVFIPTNEAMDRAFPLGTIYLSQEDGVDILQTHIAQLYNKELQAVKALNSVFTDPTVLKKGKEIKYLEKKSEIAVRNFIPLQTVNRQKLYWTNKKIVTKGKSVPNSPNVYYVNSAQVVPGSESNAGGGTFRLITEVMYPSPEAKSVIAYLKTREDTFSEFINIYDAFMASSYEEVIKNQMRQLFEKKGLDPQSETSFFIPQNYGFYRLPLSTKRALKKHKGAMLKFLISHIAYNQVVFLSWLRNKFPVLLKLQMMVGPKLMFFDASLENVMSLNKNHKGVLRSGSNVAKIYNEAMPLGAGVLFEISKPIDNIRRNFENTVVDPNSVRLSCQKW